MKIKNKKTALVSIAILVLLTVALAFSQTNWVSTHFAISGLPDGLTISSITSRYGADNISIWLSGTPTTANPNPQSIIFPSHVPSQYAHSATAPIPINGSVTISKVAPKPTISAVLVGMVFQTVYPQVFLPGQRKT